MGCSDAGKRERVIAFGIAVGYGNVFVFCIYRGIGNGDFFIVFVDGDAVVGGRYAVEREISFRFAASVNNFIFFAVENCAGCPRILVGKAARLVARPRVQSFAGEGDALNRDGVSCRDRRDSYWVVFVVGGRCECGNCKRIRIVGLTI